MASEAATDRTPRVLLREILKHTCSSLSRPDIPLCGSIAAARSARSTPLRIRKSSARRSARSYRRWSKGRSMLKPQSGILPAYGRPILGMRHVAIEEDTVALIEFSIAGRRAWISTEALQHVQEFSPAWPSCHRIPRLSGRRG